jgi:phosphoribosylaminoimidazolecarboxamide formyltransferase/IMP cyclohydrolase
LLALLSVSDKRALVPFAQGLAALGFNLLSTGGTQKVLSDSGVPVRSVADHTQSPEILGGRVKTLHPRIHGGLLARLERAQDRAQLAEQGITPISVLAVNLYPFRETVSSGAPEAEVLEQIDVGGPAMLRAAAKNAEHVLVVVDPDDYPRVLEALRGGNPPASLRRALQRKAFAHTAAYDSAIADYLAKREGEPFPEELSFSGQRAQVLRYGENPHQAGALYRTWPPPPGPSVAHAAVLQGKELSYNNLLDLDSALGLALEFAQHPTAVVVKHNNPCGVAQAQSLEHAYRIARAVDELSAFGGIVALTRPVDEPTAVALTETFLEAVVAPGYSESARAQLAKKKNLRLLDVAAAWGKGVGPFPAREVRTVAGGFLVQDRDSVEPSQEWRVVSQRAPTETEQAALRFAWRVCKHVKSNAIVFAEPDRLLAAGGGQTSRVDAVRIATQRGGERLRGSAVASDAFFPFRDGLDEVARAGARAVVQPGGSVRDDEVIAAANEHGLAMVFTGVRHFRH